jgi:hypothetical protein
MGLATTRYVREMVGLRGPQHPRRMELGGGATFPWSSLGFGYGLNPDGDNAAEIVIYAGEVHHGARAVIEVAETKVVLTEDYQYVWVEYVMGSGVATIGGPSTARPVTTDADSTFREWLYLFRLQTGTASLDSIGHMGNIIIPGAFG